MLCSIHGMSKRVLTVLVLLASVALLAIPYRIWRVSRAVGELERIGAAIDDDDLPGLGPTEIIFGPHAPGEKVDIVEADIYAVLPVLPDLWRLRCVMCEDNAWSTACLISLLQVTNWEKVFAGGTRVDGDCLRALCACGKELRELDIRNTRVPISELRQLAALPRLQRLYVGGNGFSEMEMDELKAALPGVAIVN